MKIHIGCSSPGYDQYSESKCAEYLNRIGYVNLYIHQKPKTLSKNLKALDGKRPDFIVRTDKGTVVIVEVKTSSLDYTPHFTLSLDEVKQNIIIRDIFKMEVFFAYPIDKWFELWGFISLTEVELLYEKQRFQYIPLKFIRIPVHKLNPKIE